MRQFRAWCLGNTVRYFIIITYVIIIITTTTISLLPFHYQDHHFPTSCSAGIKCDSQDMAFLVNFLEVVVFFFFFSQHPTFVSEDRVPTFTKFTIPTFKLSPVYYIAHLPSGSQNPAVSFCVNNLLTSQSLSCVYKGCILSKQVCGCHIARIQ